MENQENTTVETNESTQQENTPKTFSQEEVNKMIQSEADRRVNEALNKERRKNDEAYKLQNMSTEEKAAYEYNQKLSELESREKALAQKELIAEVTKQIGEKGLPIEAAQFLVTDSAESTKENITVFEKMFNTAIKEEVSKRIATGAPKGAAVSNGAMTKEQFQKMTLSQQANIYKTNPEIYKVLTQK